MKDITAALKDAVDTDVADKDGNYVERFNAEISSEKPADSPFSLVNGKTHLAGTVVSSLTHLLKMEYFPTFYRVTKQLVPNLIDMKTEVAYMGLKLKRNFCCDVNGRFGTM